MDIINGGGWLKPSLLALLFWGLWGFLTKVGSDKVSWQTMLLYFGICTIVIALVGYKGIAFGHDKYHLAALLAGIAVTLGYVYFFIAISKGSATTVIPVTSLYVALASILAFIFLAEPITIKKVLGILCAISAVILLSD